jgi:MerR family transcriptional regulator, thiopeptide resistance regulator
VQHMSAFEMESGPEQAWKVGTLAKATGLTVRALHHYDHIGLLSPSRRTAAGHRLYTADDVAGLYRIRADRCCPSRPGMAASWRG